MTDGDKILAAILANPDDDLPRLAYADWCEENGNLVHAHFIRAQLADPNDCTIAHSPVGAMLYLQRGFVGEAYCPLNWWLQHGSVCVREHPLRRVLITDREPTSYLIAGRFVWKWSHTGGSIQYAKQAIPFKIWHHLPCTTGLVFFDNTTQAMEALSQACLTWAKAQSPQEPFA